METLDWLNQNAQSLFWQGVEFVEAFLLQIEIVLRQPLGQAGLSSHAQLISLLALCVVVVLLTLRAFGGLLRAALLIIVAAMFVHLLTTQVHFTT